MMLLLKFSRTFGSAMTFHSSYGKERYGAKGGYGVWWRCGGVKGGQMCEDALAWVCGCCDVHVGVWVSTLCPNPAIH